MKIMLGIDGSAHALHALTTVLRWRDEGLPCSFVLANVQEPASLYEVVVAHDPEVIEKVRGAAGADLLLPAEAMLDAAGAEYESEVAGGVPEHLLVELAENYGCDLVVVGARGEGAADGRGLGSVALAVLQSCPIPVTVVRVAEPPEAAADSSSEAAGTGEP